MREKLEWNWMGETMTVKKLHKQEKKEEKEERTEKRK